MAIGDTIWLTLLRSVVGYGTAGDVVGPITESAVTEAIVAAGWATQSAVKPTQSNPPRVAASDGQVPAWSAALGTWVATNPTGQAEVASAQNSTGAATALTTVNGAPTMQAVPGTAITIPASAGRPVTVEWEATFNQTVAGAGNLWLNVQAGATLYGSSIHALPGSTAFGAAIATCFGKARLGVLAAPLTVQLYANVSSPAGANGQLLNNGGYPTLMRAVAG